MILRIAQLLFLACISVYNRIIIIIIIIQYVCLLSQAFLPGTSLEPAVIPTAHASSFSLHTFRIVCDVPSIAVFCSESIECFPGIVPKFFLKLLVTIPVAPIITGIIVYFRFHIRYYYYYYFFIIIVFLRVRLCLSHYFS